ncbi:MAG TPA: hypothetical protein VMX94_08070 [Armatimonadota bacterium]|nr:hypothetical protein [Armatimonadota bacterium]
MKKLLESLKQAGQQAVVLDGRIGVLPFGGRIIGLCPDGETNVLWTNRVLDSADSARAFFASVGWPNSGGDRTWISPEIDTNIGDPERSGETYDVPRAVDPGAYAVTGSAGDSVTLETDMNVLFRRSGHTVPLHTTKQVKAMRPAIDIPDGVSAAGYALTMTIKAKAPIPEGVHPAIWNLAQVPGGGRMLFPVRGDLRTHAFIGKPVFQARDGLVETVVQTADNYKFGIHVSCSTGVMLYLRQQGAQSTLVVRKFDVWEDGFYSDVPCDDPGAMGYIQQAYVDNGDLGGFGELEYHSPAIGGPTGREEVTDRSELWAFSGPPQAISEVSEVILSSAPCRP